MVRKGSPVRVRQRALEKAPHRRGFFFAQSCPSPACRGKGGTPWEHGPLFGIGGPSARSTPQGSQEGPVCLDRGSAVPRTRCTRATTSAVVRVCRREDVWRVPSRIDILNSIRAWERQYPYDVRDVYSAVKYQKPLPRGLGSWDAQEAYQLWADYRAAEFAEDIDRHVRARELETNPPERPPFNRDEDIPF